MPTFRRVRLALLFPAAALALMAPRVVAQQPKSPAWDVTIPPGANFDKAEFRLWVPANLGSAKAVVVIVPGSNGDWRTMVDDSVWQAFATRHQVALLGCRFTDRPHDQSFIEDYVNVSKGSGQALLDALASLGQSSRHPELASAPLLLWGMSAGGQFNYEFTAWKPERVVAFIANKGGIYYSALTPAAARRVPGLLLTGGKDLEQRVSTINGLFAVNRRGQALWALAEEPGVAHVVGRSRDLALIFFDDALRLRLPSSAGAPLNELSEASGFIGDSKTRAFAPVSAGKAPIYPVSWLFSERMARAWLALLTEAPFPP